jgi:hypothetical protein
MMLANIPAGLLGNKVDRIEVFKPRRQTDGRYLVLSPISARKKATSAEINAPERLIAVSLPSY